MQMYTVSLLRHIWGSGAVHFIRDLVLHNSVNTYTRQDLGILDSVIFRAKFDKIEKKLRKILFPKTWEKFERIRKKYFENFGKIARVF